MSHWQVVEDADLFHMKDVWASASLLHEGLNLAWDISVPMSIQVPWPSAGSAQATDSSVPESITSAVLMFLFLFKTGPKAGVYMTCMFTPHHSRPQHASDVSQAARRRGGLSRGGEGLYR